MPVCDAEVTSDLYSDGYYNIEGKADWQGQPVKIEIFDNGYDFSAAKSIDNDNVNNVYLYVNQIYADAEMKFSFSVPVEEKGNYKAKVSFFDGDIIEKEFCTYSDKEVEEDIKAFASDPAKTAAKLGELVNKYYPALNVDMEDLKTLADGESEKMYAAVLPRISSDTTRDELSKLINGEMAFCLISKTGDIDMLLKYEAYMTLYEANYFNDWNSLEKEQKQVFCQSLKGTTSKEEMEKRLENAVIINTLKNTIWSGMKNKLEFYKDNLSLDLTKVNDLSSYAQKSVYTDFKNALSNGSISDITEIKSEINSLVNKYSNVSAASGSGGGSSGGGSSGGGSSSSGGKVSKFTMPANIPVVQETHDTAIPFNDIAEIEWASVPIIKLYQMNILKGKPNGGFDPYGDVTREEFTVMIVRALKLENTGEENIFDDVSESRWSSADIAAARDNGIITGVDNNLFAPEKKISRQDMAVIAYRAGIAGGAQIEDSGELSFTDKEEIADYAQTAVAALNKAKVLNGSENQFLPQDYTNRAEAAVVIYRLLQCCKLID